MKSESVMVSGGEKHEIPKLLQKEAEGKSHRGSERISRGARSALRELSLVWPLRTRFFLLINKKLQI